MALIIKKKEKKVEEIKSSPVVIPNLSEGKVPPAVFYGPFAKAWLNAQNFPNKYKVLREFYFDVFLEDLPDQPLELIQLKIAYTLLEKDYIQAKIKVPQKIQQNIKAAQAFNIKGLSTNLRQMVEINLKYGKDSAMKVAAKAEPKAKGKTKEVKKEKASVGVSHLYLEIFSNQGKKQLTDVQIADFIKEKAGTRPTEKNVASYRFMYNAGKLAGQTSVPKEKVKAVRVSKKIVAAVQKPKKGK